VKFLLCFSNGCVAHSISSYALYTDTHYIKSPRHALSITDSDHRLVNKKHW
jgi:hypothetical protein